MYTIDPEAPEPPFEQLRSGIVDAIATGALAPGARLPTVRGLAEELGVAAGTVARTYRELEASGIIETRGRSGTFVAFAADPARREAERAAAEYAERVKTLRVSPEDALALVAVALGDPAPRT
ncbi:GntR family transcriptional regulator [Microbacterium sp. C7(2022)]|uniref:GntR family transcriptional regulator n=1 Tax=Microbacterium sp. C7(2022) TaxID=2992759 RepID=UPI00237B2DC3|nr:GntR family transcriptional regulator [Microbacterium sp. C7(2022)]MDE0546753.1 GntR family transcriptional regulator [Microbacterium sp. C7(2022)]